MKKLFFILFLIFCYTISYGQWIYVSGKIVNSNTKNGISNISVVDKNSNIGTISNQDGTFKIALKKGQAHLVFSDTNYSTYEISFLLEYDKVLYIELKPSNKKR